MSAADQGPKSGLSKKGWVARGGLTAVLEIFKRLDPAHRERLMKSVGERDPELVARVQAGWFSFEDLKALPARELQKLLLQVPEAILPLALRNASAELLAAIHQNLPKRVSDGLRERIQALGPRRLTDVQEAQRKILELGKSLKIIRPE